MNDETDGTPRHPIRVVARRTGLSPAVLRAWERRYDVVTPTRSEGGQRLYTDRDVRRLSLIAQALEVGRSIGHVAPLSDDDIQQLVEEDSRARPQAPARVPDEGATPAASSILDVSLKAVEALDSAALERELMRATVLLSPGTLIEGVILPLLRRIGLLWEHGTVGPAAEHVASVTVRRFLDWLQDAFEAPDTSPVLLCGTPAGHRHEFGALIAAAMAAQSGWRGVYLGPDLPADEIAATARRLGASAIALSAVFPVDDSGLSAQVTRLMTLVPPGTRVFVGGPAARLHEADLSADGATVLASLDDLRAHLLDGAGDESSDAPVRD
jgi:DNA-binding transcriptional MerR regulator